MKALCGKLYFQLWLHGQITSIVKILLKISSSRQTAGKVFFRKYFGNLDELKVRQ